MVSFEFIGWCNEGEGNHDKIWCNFKVENTWYCAWGRRGAKLSFKKHPSFHSVSKVQRSKENRYKPVDQFLMFSIFPTFEEDLEQTLVMSTLAGKVK